MPACVCVWVEWRECSASGGKIERGRWEGGASLFTFIRLFAQRIFSAVCVCVGASVRG